MWRATAAPFGAGTAGGVQGRGAGAGTYLPAGWSSGCWPLAAPAATAAPPATPVPSRACSEGGRAGRQEGSGWQAAAQRAWHTGGWVHGSGSGRGATPGRKRALNGHSWAAQGRESQTVCTASMWGLISWGRADTTGRPAATGAHLTLFQSNQFSSSSPCAAACTRHEHHAWLQQKLGTRWVAVVQSSRAGLQAGAGRQPCPQLPTYQLPSLTGKPP